MDLENAREQAKIQIQQEQFKSESEQQKEMFDASMTETRQQRLQDLGVTQQDFDLSLACGQTLLRLVVPALPLNQSLAV